MKLAPAVLALLVLLPSAPALARAGDCVRLSHFDCDDPLRWAARHDERDARLAITTEDGKVTLLLTDRVVAMQLSDRTMRKVDRELHRARHEDDDDDGPLADAIKTAVIGTVRSVLDHSAECPVREIRDVRYERGRLVLVARDGERLFERLEVDDDDVLEAFDPRDAADFVREFRRLKAARDWHPDAAGPAPREKAVDDGPGGTDTVGARSLARPHPCAIPTGSGGSRDREGWVPPWR